MGCILDACEELEEERRRKHEEYVRTGFQPDCRRCHFYNYGKDNRSKKCRFDKNPDHCGDYRELEHRYVLDRMEEISEIISILRVDLHFLEAMDDEYETKKNQPSENDRKFAADYFGIPYPEKECEPDSDEEDDEVDIDELEKTSFELPKKMR